MSETPQEAQEGVADAVRGLSDNTSALVRHEIAAAQQGQQHERGKVQPAQALGGEREAVHGWKGETQRDEAGTSPP